MTVTPCAFNLYASLITFEVIASHRTSDKYFAKRKHALNARLTKKEREDNL